MNLKKTDTSARHPAWQYDEFRQAGRDYGDPAEVNIYDSSHADFRDVAAEGEAVLAALHVDAHSTVADFGCGTGNFALMAAERCGKVHAIDVSLAMLERARKRAAEAGRINIEFHHAGFLTFDCPAETIDGITSTFALHHLPDLWKGVALRRMWNALKPGGRFHLHDVVVPHGEDSLERIARFVARQEKAGGEFLREDAEGHFREEFSTCDWIMEGLLTRAGFELLSFEIQNEVLLTAICRKG